MAESRRDRIDRLERHVQFSIAVLKRLDRSALEHLMRASEVTSEIDGHSGGGQSERVDGSGIEESDATISAALARLCPSCEGRKTYADSYGTIHACRVCGGTGTRKIPDPLADAVEELFVSLAELSGHATIIGRKMHVVIDAAGRLRDRVSTLTDCRGCHRPVLGGVLDPIRAGYCDACRKAFARFKAKYGTDDNGADRIAFAAERARFDGHLESACPVCVEAKEMRRAS